MTTPTSNRRTGNTDHTFVNTFVDAASSHEIATAAALYYPSLIGNCWDDELLPSGD